MQLSLFGDRPLFEARVYNRSIDAWRKGQPVDISARSADLKAFLEATSKKGIKGAKEPELEQAFNSAFFCELLGYALYAGDPTSCTAWPKPGRAVTGIAGEPDLILGSHDGTRFAIDAVVELKKPKTNLDAPQPGYSNRSAVEQAFDYAVNIPGCSWVLVSNMHEVRIYSTNSRDAHHTIHLTSGFVDTSAIEEAVFLLSYERLLVGQADSSVARLRLASENAQASFREGFYDIYSQIREDIRTEITSWNENSGCRFSTQEVVLASQRLLDRIIFIHFCEDHPDRLLRNNILGKLTAAAVEMPGPSRTKAFDAVKQLFCDLDTGQDTPYWVIPRYNGELFKPHAILDELKLPDSLYSKRYRSRELSGDARRDVLGIFGLHIFDFWRELDRDLLGNIFERSLGDLAVGPDDGVDARSRFGVFYTASRLASFAAHSAVETLTQADPVLNDRLSKMTRGSPPQKAAAAERVAEQIGNYRIADVACGSGVFLTAALEALLAPYRKALSALNEESSLVGQLLSTRQAEILSSAVYGADLLPQAIELAKLSLWLTAARKNEPSADLSGNFLIGDFLADDAVDRLLSVAGGSYDLLVGNPPWGGEFDGAHVAEIVAGTGLPQARNWDTWELFLVRSHRLLKEGGRICLVLPHTLLSEDRAPIRRWLSENYVLEKVYLLGPDWFTNSVRMSTVLVQAVKGRASPDNQFQTLLLSGEMRLKALAGNVSLKSIEAQYAQPSLQRRIGDHNAYAFSPAASEVDHVLMDKIRDNSVSLESVTDRARGDEINGDGLLWQCGSCLTKTMPGVFRKGQYQPKNCRTCGLELSSTSEFPERLISATRSAPYSVPFIDGKALAHRYQEPQPAYIRLDLGDLGGLLKPQHLYQGERILVRQAGVGITATIVTGEMRCTQSMYIYRSNNAAYSNRFLLACLCSRAMNYYLMKQSGNVDPSQAFGKLTHATLAQLPVPLITSEAAAGRVRQIEEAVSRMLAGAPQGGTDDLQIEQHLRALWRVDAAEGHHINRFFGLLPAGQYVKDLFPSGVPA